MGKFIAGYLLAVWAADKVVRTATGKTLQELTKEVKASLASHSYTDGIDVDLLTQRIQEHLGRNLN